MSVLTSFEISASEFDTLRELVSEHMGISLSQEKVQLVKRRLTPRLRELNLGSFSAYIKYLKVHENEYLNFSDAITTNLTSFFRESHHFEYLKSDVLPALLAKRGGQKRLRFWSAGCSYGHEPYTLAMVLKDSIPDINSWDVKILATDLDRNCLNTGKNGVYAANDLAKVPERLRKKWFDIKQDKAHVKPELKKLIQFNHLNLMHPLPVRGPIDVIFCRNVFIYFNKDRQKHCVDKFGMVQETGDHLFIGHAESIGELTDYYDLVGQTTYVRN